MYSVFPISKLTLDIFPIFPHQRALENSKRDNEKAYKTWKRACHLHNLMGMRNECANPHFCLHKKCKYKNSMGNIAAFFHSQ